MQIWFLYITSLIVKPYNFPIERIFLDGVLLFFSSTLIAAITIDYHVYPRRKRSKRFDWFLFSIFPILLLLSCTLIFSICIDKLATDIDMNVLASIELGIVSSSIIYAFVGKIYQN